MENKRLKLPIGIQTFETIRTENYLYVDKTKYLVDLINSGKIYFLARPRRFGKSLTVSTFDALFSGKKELFKGLYAEEFMNRPDYISSPVIWLDMSSVATEYGIDGLRESIKQKTIEIADGLGVEVPKNLLAGDLLRNLITGAAKKYDRKAVILLDEYDKPYTDFVNDPDMAEKVRNVLRNYYVQIKANDKDIRFTFITGISKFAKFGVFSTLNTPLDISMNPKYAEICGYTEDEIIQYFPDYLEETAIYMEITTDELIRKMRGYYNGFTFDRNAHTRLYNPYSTLSFFADMDFSNYWIETGSSRVIAEYMKSKNLTVEQFRDFSISKDFAKSPGDMDNTPPYGFLYQGGYLTLRPGIGESLFLDYPNTEVLNSMSAMLTQNILREKDEDFSRCRSELLTGLISVNHRKIIAAFNRLLASIPYDDFAKTANDIVSDDEYNYKPREWIYRSSLLAFLRGCGVLVFAEMHTNLGRSDIVVVYCGKTWVIELKVAYKGECPAQKAEEALQQIIDKNYATPYPDAVCMGLAIDDAVRQITDVRLKN